MEEKPHMTHAREPRSHSWTSLRSLARSVLGDDWGNAVVEFAVLGPILVLVLFGVIDFGRAFVAKKQLSEAVSQGAAYAINSGYSSSGITNAITSAGPTGLVASPTPSQFCGCPNAQTGVSAASGTPPSCTGTCTSGGTPGTYTTINAQMPYKASFPWPGLSQSINLTATTTVRLK